MQVTSYTVKLTVLSFRAVLQNKGDFFTAVGLRRLQQRVRILPTVLNSTFNVALVAHTLGCNSQKCANYDYVLMSAAALNR